MRINPANIESVREHLVRDFAARVRGSIDLHWRLSLAEVLTALEIAQGV